jgi:hypothetical protein
MATKKTTDKKTPAKKPAKAPAKAKGAPKTARAKAETKPAGPRHPKGRVAERHGSKTELAKSLAASLARPDEDEGVIADRLRTASNSQLLRLQHVVATVKEKYGDRAKLIAAIGTAEHKSTDKDFLAHLDTFSLPHLLDLAAQHERRARV